MNRTARANLTLPPDDVIAVSKQVGRLPLPHAIDRYNPYVLMYLFIVIDMHVYAMGGAGGGDGGAFGRRCSRRRRACLYNTIYIDLYLYIDLSLSIHMHVSSRICIERRGRI